MPSVLFTRKVDLYTSYTDVISCFLKAHTFSQHTLDRCFIIEKLRMTISGTDTLCCLDEQFVWCIFVHTYTEPRVHHTCVHRCFQTKHCHIIGCIMSVFVYTTNGQGLSTESTSVTKCHTSFIFQFRSVVHLNVLNFQKFKSELFCNDSVIYIMFVEWIQPLVETSVRNRMSVSFNFQKLCSYVEQLHCSPVCLWSRSSYFITALINTK